MATVKTAPAPHVLRTILGRSQFSCGAGRGWREPFDSSTCRPSGAVTNWHQHLRTHSLLLPPLYYSLSPSPLLKVKETKKKRERERVCVSLKNPTQNPSLRESLIAGNQSDGASSEGGEEREGDGRRRPERRPRPFHGGHERRSRGRRRPCPEAAPPRMPTACVEIIGI